MIRFDDLVITIAYFSIPLQILVSLWHYPRLASMPVSILVLLVLFALFILLCGTGHLLRCTGRTNETVYAVLNGLTAFISISTSLYLLPLIPSVMSTLDDSLSLARLNAEIVESKRQLLTFMAFLCHEIRNPLFAITSTLSFLEDDHEELSTDQSRAVASINQSTKLMLRLVNDVLDLRKIESGKLELENRHFDLCDVIKQVAASTDMQVELHHPVNSVAFVFTLDPTLPRIISGDSVRILQIAYNLLSNANKFTEEGRIEFTVSAVDYDLAVETGLIAKPKPAFAAEAGERRSSSLVKKWSHLLGVGGVPSSESLTAPSTETSSFMSLLQAEEGDVPPRNPRDPQHIDNSTDDHYMTVLKLEVKDTGPGIPPDRMTYIFEPYTQSKLSDFRKHGGTGLGLSILLRLSRQMGGDICATSQVGVGSTFVAYLPIAVPKHNVPEPAPESALEKARTTDLLALDILPSAFDSHFLSDQNNETTVISSNGVVSARVPQGPEPPHSYVSLLPQPVGAPVKISAANKLPKFALPPNDAVVMVVDDNKMNRSLIGRMLEHFNVEYRLACNGQEAVDAVLESRNVNPSDLSAPFYSLILMDMCMPVLGGVEATRILRVRHACTIPIAALTANAVEEHRDQAIEAGCTEFITKPILREDLYKTCQQYLMNSTRPAPNSIGARSHSSPQSLASSVE